MLYAILCVSLFAAASCHGYVTTPSTKPVVITTWAFKNATIKAWKTLYEEEEAAVDAVERGCSVCEEQQCDFTVGFGGSPDESGETTLDAMIMDGDTMNVGAVGGLRRIKSAISVARKVLDHSKHSLLVGDAATDFAKTFRFAEESLSTPYSKKLHADWLANNCQPNYWIGVKPDPSKSCGPYSPDESHRSVACRRQPSGHDTIGMVAVDSRGRLASGTSTNGLVFKTPGRVGDSPVAGAGSYADSSVGGAAATGDGDVMMRFLPSFVAVEEMKRGASPAEAARAAIKRIRNKHPDFFGAVVALARDGRHGAACNGMDKFPYVIGDDNGVIEMKINCN